MGALTVEYCHSVSVLCTYVRVVSNLFWGIDVYSKKGIN
jgi:hypothetical protein